MDNDNHQTEDMPEQTLGPEHVHNYFGRTSVEQDHFHVFEGTTGSNMAGEAAHAHRFASETSEAFGHTHKMEGMSSEPVSALLGHVHHIQGTTTFSEGHAHSFSVLTGHPRRPRNKRRRLLSPPEHEDQEDGAKPRLHFRSRFRNRSSWKKQ